MGLVEFQMFGVIHIYLIILNVYYGLAGYKFCCL